MVIGMNTFETIGGRRSYRGKYKPTPVPREDLRKIMQAGLEAPSGCNKQTTSLIAVDDPVILGNLRSVIDPPVGETAPAIICVLTRRIIAYRDRCFAVQDYSAAIQNMLLAAVELGYQSCWYEGHITDEDRIGDRMAQLLGVPEGYELVCFLPVGVAEEKPLPPKKLPFEERAWFNGYRRSYSSEFCDVEYDERHNVVLVTWKRFCCGEDYRRPLEHALGIISKYRCDYAADTRNGFENEQEDTLWVAEYFMPKAAELGCRYINFIVDECNSLREELEGQEQDSAAVMRFRYIYDINELPEIK